MINKVIYRLFYKKRIIAEKVNQEITNIFDELRDLKILKNDATIEISILNKKISQLKLNKSTKILLFQKLIELSNLLNLYNDSDSDMRVLSSNIKIMEKTDKLKVMRIGFVLFKKNIINNNLPIWLTETILLSKVIYSNDNYFILEDEENGRYSNLSVVSNMIIDLFDNEIFYERNELDTDTQEFYSEYIMNKNLNNTNI